MGKVTGFMEYPREERAYKDISDRIKNYSEFVIALPNTELQRQGARCMDCGIPFCHASCPLNNIIPDWNHLVYESDFKSALEVLHSTNNFPEFTGRICPAPCEAACTLNIDDAPVTIKTIECAIIDQAWDNELVMPEVSEVKTGKNIAVVGSGPAGLACAQQLCRAGHNVTVYEKAPVIGGLLRLGIPDFKLEKKIVERRVQQMRAEGVSFKTNTHVGIDIKVSELVDNNDCVVLTGGSEQPRDLEIAGRELSGIYFAMEFLKANSKWVQGIHEADKVISAKDKKVVVIGGGDTGSDCIGTANRHGAHSVTQLEIMPKPPEKEDKALTWPDWPHKMRTSSSQEEGGERLWSAATKEFIGNDDNQVTAIECVKVDWHKDADGSWLMSEVEGSEFTVEADLVTLAMGFLHPVHEGMLNELRLELDGKGNVKAKAEGKYAYQTSVEKVFAAGDMRRGQSLVVHAINEGRRCAKAVDKFLMGTTNLI